MRACRLEVFVAIAIYLNADSQLRRPSRKALYARGALQ
jgi:hypothetical protein